MPIFDRLLNFVLSPLRFLAASAGRLLPSSTPREKPRAETRFADIDRAWAEGLANLAAAQIALHETPLYLVLGTGNPQEADALMRAAGMDSLLPPSRERTAPLSWYASAEEIFLVVSGVGGTNQLAHREMSPSGTATPLVPPLPGHPASPPTGTITTGPPRQGPTPLRAPVPLTAPSSGGYSTLQIGDPAAFSNPARWTATAAPAAEEDPTGDLQDEPARLTHLCELLVTARAPVCPLNGLLVLLPFDVVRTLANPLHDTLQTDIQIVQQTTMLRFPVIALVSEMHTETGFVELVRRVGPDLARNQRFGKGSDHRVRPTSEHVLAVTRHACGAFEDWTYMLFQQDGGLKQPGNSALCGLLCKIRGGFTEALISVLTSGFGSDAEESDAEDEQLLFAGCYFAATGPTPEHQAFVRGVFGKLSALQGEIAWTAAAYLRDQHYQRLAKMALVAGITGIALLIFLWWQG